MFLLGCIAVALAAALLVAGSARLVTAPACSTLERARGLVLGGALLGAVGGLMMLLAL